MIASRHMPGKSTIICVAGPTASGKTSRALSIAQERNGEVISVDSRQVYRTLDIGTEKISVAEMQGIPHHLIDIREPEENYSAGDFVRDAEHLIEDITSRGKLPVLAGGTHYYFHSLIYGLPGGSDPDPALRAELEALNDEELFKEIQVRDPRRASDIDPKNRRRLVRALELIRAFGKVPERNSEPLYHVEWEMLLPERSELRPRIVARLEDALQRGLVDEVKKTRERVGDARLNELGLEYRIVGEYLRGERDEASLLPALSAKLFQYARRQEAWLRKLSSGLKV